MARTKGKRTDVRNLTDLADQFELDVYQSTNVNELNKAYQLFLGHSPRVQLDIIAQVGTARMVALTLRGYELPDAATRLASNQFVLQLMTLIDETQTPQSIKEQIWLVLAQQKDVLLEKVEADLDALQHSALSAAETARRQDALGSLHKTLRIKTDRAVARLLGATVADITVSVA